MLLEQYHIVDLSIKDIEGGVIMKSNITKRLFGLALGMALAAVFLTVPIAAYAGFWPF